MEEKTFLYGMGSPRFVDYAEKNYGVKLSDRESKEYRIRFFEEYSELPTWHDKQRRIVRAYKQVRNLIGRLRRLPEIDSPDRSKSSEAERQSINSPVQSLASDIMLMSLIEVDENLPKEDTRIIGSVHDAGLFIIRNDMLNTRLPQIKKIMENPPLLTEVFNTTLDVPLTVDVDIGDWGAGIGWNGEHVEVDEEGNISLSKKQDKKVRYYMYHPVSGELFTTRNRKARRRQIRRGYKTITRREYQKMKGKR